MSYHGKLQTLKHGTADAEIQLWAYQQLEKEPAKTLTDEEIRSIHEQTDGNLNMIDFARAILRKASEK
jgi:hypothetical protein